MRNSVSHANLQSIVYLDHPLCLQYQTPEVVSTRSPAMSSNVVPMPTHALGPIPLITFPQTHPSFLSKHDDDYDWLGLPSPYSAPVDCFEDRRGDAEVEADNAERAERRREHPHLQDWLDVRDP